MRDPYASQRRQFISETQRHEMRVLHDEGLYRHLRFQAPGTGIWHWDLITWPGSLAIRGDIGEGHIFTRVDDMLRFFDHGQHAHQINADYWAEKLDLGRNSVKEFSAERFGVWCADGEYPINSADGLVDHEQAAIDTLDDLGVEWDFEDLESWRDYGHHFIIALHAILWGAKRYHESKERA
ncbi:MULTISPECIES: hypothetical protein [unclassified Microbacterium]|uniref:hypothetical protein n=1 Tax=unclassified Microbacterium TaxID=2609290 RepID=UPI000EA8E9E2|nr:MULTISPECIES: hypothetical protein [unclassified Microbacterium]MBT2484822.1 hypothetical protein [Microbacterium sp. ISL-108]RKN67693.1 hypothetical protein D7252_08900 [Microbacterium sp. CGR2]